MEKKTGNLGCFVCPLPVFFSLNYQPFLATLPVLDIKKLRQQNVGVFLSYQELILFNDFAFTS